MTHKITWWIESPSLIRMHLKDKITYDQAFGIEEFFRWKNQATYQPDVNEENDRLKMIGDFIRVRKELRYWRGKAAEVLLWHFVCSNEAQTWSPYDDIHKKRKGWMKGMILFAGEQLSHVSGYFGEGT